MSKFESARREGLFAYYWRQYLEWRAEHGVGDEGMNRLVTAMKAEFSRTRIARDELARLQRLAGLIEAEMTLMRVAGRN